MHYPFGSHNSILFPSGSYTHGKRSMSVVAAHTVVLVALMVSSAWRNGLEQVGQQLVSRHLMMRSHIREHAG
jgi:hypothetical protein